jgi:hypothetical protein
MRSVEEHRRVVASLLTAPAPVNVALADAAGRVLADAAGRVLADDAVASVSLLPFDNSAMDGYAVRAADIAGASVQAPVVLPVAADIPAGRVDVPMLDTGTAHRIMTGAASQHSEGGTGGRLSKSTNRSDTSTRTPQLFWTWGCAGPWRIAAVASWVARQETA